MSIRNGAQVNEQIPEEQYPSQPLPPRTGPQTGAPIAKVLNQDTPVHYAPQHLNAVHTHSTTPFSGRLVDLLLDTPEQKTSRERNECLLSENRLTESNHSVIQLPKLPQPAAKKAKRPRIPPLLQGLHQPPPLPPSNQLFPPITSDKNAFACTSRDRGNFDPRAGPANAPNAAATNTGTPNKGLEKSGILSVNDFVQSTTSNSIDCPKNTSLDDKIPTSKDVAHHKAGRKRRKWSEQETKDLLIGVSRFGIGSWKKILSSADLKFHGRTAVDLKDRFRVCCPDEASKAKRGKTKAKATPQGQQSELLVTRLPSFVEVSMSEYQGFGGSDLPPPESPPAAKQKTSRPSMVVSQMAEIGIQGPFLRRSRRPQCKFSAQDDVNLLQGFEKYGSVWHAIRDDADLGFNGRHPTDLRDRFRIRYPEKFAKAGHKLKAKHGNIIAHDQKIMDERRKHAGLLSPGKSTPPQPDTRSALFGTDMERLGRPNDQIPEAILSPMNHTPRSNEFASYTFDPFPMMFDDDYGRLEHEEFSNSPIILNRDILQWADGNHSSSYNQVGSYGTSDTFSKPSNAMDGNPFSTWPGIQGPSTDVSFNSLPPVSSLSTTNHTRSTSANGIIDTRTNISPSNMVTTAITTVTKATAATAATTVKDDMLKTPNLPTIVYPHVPAASARNAMLNLPTPADLLSGMEDDSVGFMV